MKYLQFLATVICVLLAIIALQLRGLRPVTGADLEKLGTNDGAYEKMQRMLPVVNVQRVSSVRDVSVSDTVDVDVKNTVDVEVKNTVQVEGAKTMDVEIRNVFPVPVKIDR